jgi:hypothetical protein
MFDRRANEDEALRNWRVALEQCERKLAQPTCNYALPHVRRWIEDKQHLQLKIAEIEAKRAREHAPPALGMQAPEPAAEPALNARRLTATIESPSAARQMEVYLKSKGIGQTEFANLVGTTDRTLWKFRKTGKVRRDIFKAIAEAMGTTKEALLKTD